MASLIGQSLGRYHILEQLGEGGMATVYKAFDTRLETDVAVKIIRTENFTPAVLTRALKRFEREAKALARLTHPNIVKVIDYGEYEGQPYLVMEYLVGGTLKQHLGQSMPYQEAARILAPIARALEYAHQHDIVHRDVKPSNILITESGQPMLSDFGVAKILEADETMDLTGTSMGVGTPEYMAPEQVTSKIVDARADVYSLGVIFYELVVGRKPYVADTPMAVLFKHASEPLPRPKNFVPALPDAVEHVLFKALAKKPEDRYQDMGEFAKMMETLAQGEKISVGQIAPSPSAKTPRSPILVGTLSGLVVLFIGITLVVATKMISQKQNAIWLFPWQATLTSTPTDTPTPTNTLTLTNTSLPTRTFKLTTVSTSTPNLTKFLGTSAPVKTFEVEANLPWQDTQVVLSTGNVVKVEYLSGQWTTWLGGHPFVGPTGNEKFGDPKNQNHPVPSAYPGVLIAKVGNGAAFEIGQGKTFEVMNSGELYLQMNDDYLGDNSGSITVRITISGH